MQRYAGAKPGDPVPDELRAFIAGQAPKRIGLVFRRAVLLDTDDAARLEQLLHVGERLGHVVTVRLEP